MRYRETAAALISHVRLRPFSALRAKWREGYSAADLRADLSAGCVVGLVAIPLSMALAIASGVPPQHGLYTAIIAGFATALFGGSRFQVTGPTAAFVVILAPVVGRYGLRGLLLAGLMAGGLLVLMGVCRMGRLIQFIPYPVTVGFTSGIALVIATIQLKDFFGLRIEQLPHSYFDRVAHLLAAAATWSPAETAVAAFTLALLLFWPKPWKKFPAPLGALLAAVALSALIRKFTGIEVATIATRFSQEIGGELVRGIPPSLPGFRLPWTLPGPAGAPFVLSLRAIEELVPAAFAIAMLGAIESLLSAVVADGMGRTRHDPDAELIAVGAGNLLCPFWGGIPATGAIARTAANIRFGARSPLAAMTHAAFIFAVALSCAPAISRIPVAALAALLMLVAYNMSELRHFRHILAMAPRSDVLVLLICFTLTVMFDMVMGVGVGIVLASLLFMRRMASLTSGQLIPPEHPARAVGGLPAGAVVYEIAGPLCFGAADNAIDALSRLGNGLKAVVFLMDAVPAMDVTGLVAFESAVEELLEAGRSAVLVGVRPQPMALLRRSAVFRGSEKVYFCKDMREASAALREGGLTAT